VVGDILIPLGIVQINPVHAPVHIADHELSFLGQTGQAKGLHRDTGDEATRIRLSQIPGDQPAIPPTGVEKRTFRPAIKSKYGSIVSGEALMKLKRLIRLLHHA
jgi:hypothetical protein